MYFSCAYELVVLRWIAGTEVDVLAAAEKAGTEVTVLAAVEKAGTEVAVLVAAEKAGTDFFVPDSCLPTY